MSNDAPARPLPTPGAVGDTTLTSPEDLVEEAVALAGRGLAPPAGPGDAPAPHPPPRRGAGGSDPPGRGR
ncbi:MAG: hypothetical protein ACTHNI_11515, partial [Cellulosimicrobium cellulans]